MALRTDYKNAVFSGKRKYHLIENEDGTVSLLDATQYSQTGDRFGAKDVNDIGTAVNGLADSIGDAFSEEKTYAAGEYAIYDNALYEFTAAKAAGPWDPDVAALTTIADALSELNGNLTATDNTSFRFGVDSDGNYGYIILGEDGADTVVPFKTSSVEIIAENQSGNKTFDVSGHAGWQKLTADNFIISVKMVPWAQKFGSNNGNNVGVVISSTAGPSNNVNISKKYNPETGVFTATVPSIMISAYAGNLGISNRLQTHTVNMVYDVYLVG